MALLPIVEVPDPRLRQISSPVEKVDDALRALVADMFETMYDAPGIGLAAIQVGSDWYASTDYETHQTSLTKAQAYTHDDGVMRFLVVVNEGAQPVPGLRRDHDAGTTWGDDIAELLEDQRGAVQIDREDCFR